MWCVIFATLLPVAVVYAVIQTSLDATAGAVGALAALASPAPAAKVAADPRPALVFPGTCTWVFWQSAPSVW